MIRPPVEGYLECVLGMQCILTIQSIQAGVYLDYPTDNEYLLLANGVCGDASPVTAAWTGSSNPPVLEARDENGGTYSFGTPLDGTPGNFYELCWASSPTADLSSYNLQVDTRADLIGPSPAHLACTLGLPCSLTLTGWRQREEDRLIVQSGGTTCGSGDPVAWTGVDFPIVAQITAIDGTEAVYFAWNSDFGGAGE
jgi:hypothetical protein